MVVFVSFEDDIGLRICSNQIEEILKTVFLKHSLKEMHLQSWYLEKRTKLYAVLI